MFKTELDKILFEPPQLGTILFMPGLPQSGGIIHDRSPYGNHGTITGATWARLPSGLWVLSFDGSDDYISVPDADSLDISVAITVEMWIYVNSLASAPMVLDKAYATSYYLQLGVGGSITFAGKDAAASTLSSGDGYIVTGKWHRIMGTFDTTTDTMNIGVNGVSIASATNKTGIIGVNATQIIIGQVNALTGNKLNGLIGLFRICNRALSALEDSNHYNQERHLFV